MRQLLRYLLSLKPRVTFVAAFAVVLLDAYTCATWARSLDSHLASAAELAMPVVTATATRQEVPIYLDGIGTVVASKTP